MSTVGCCCRVPGGFALRGVSVSASVYVVKQNDREAAHLKAREERAFKEKRVVLSSKAVPIHSCYRSLAVIWFLS